MNDDEDVRRTHPLATKDGLEVFVRLLLISGALCPVCHYGTRAKSKKWAVCKKCGTRVLRQPLPDLRSDQSDA